MAEEEQGASLAAIRAKEDELNAGLEAARDRAKTTIDSAHDESRRLEADAKARAKADSESQYATEVEAARKEAEEIRARIPAEVEAVSKRALGRVAGVADAIVRQVLPNKKESAG